MSTIPSISLIPSGYKANKVYSVLPTDGAADLTFARTSSATRVNSNNLIEEVATGVPRLDYTDGTCPSLLLEPQSTNLITYPLSFGNNYWTKSGASIEGDASTAGVEKVVNGDFASSVSWNLNANWSISGGVITADGSTSADANQTNNLPTVNSTYLVTYTISNYTSGSFIISYGGDLTSPKVANGTYTEQITASSTDRLRLKGSNPFGSIDNVSIKEVQGFSAPSVDNPTSAFKLVEDTSSGEHYIQGNVTKIDNTTYSSSYYVKALTNNYGFRISPIAIGSSVAVSNANFSITNGVPILNSVSGLVLSASIKLLQDDFYRVSVIYTLDGTVSSHGSRFYLRTQATFTGDGTSGVYIFAAQLEQQSFATSLMLPNTEGSTVTRVAETASKTGLASYINGVEGVLYFNSSIYLDDGVLKKISLSSGSDDNAISISYDVALGNISFTVRVGGGATSTQITATSIIKTNNNKIAFKYKENNFSAFINGVKVGEDLVGGVFGIGVLNKISFDRGNAANIFYGKCKDLRVYKTALTDAELVTLTTI